MAKNPHVIFPSRETLCAMLAKDHKAGLLLLRIKTWQQYARAKIPGTPGYWIANRREWWCREAALSLSQYDRAVARLNGQGLIEKRQWWFAGGLITFVRLSWASRCFFLAASTWDAATELCAGSGDWPSQSASPALVDVQKPKPDPFSENEKLASAVLQSSNNKHTKQTHSIQEALEIAHAANPPVCVMKHSSISSEPSETKSCAKTAASLQYTSAETFSPSAAAHAFTQTAQSCCPQASASVSPSEFSAIATWIEGLKFVDGPHEDLRPHAVDILVHAVVHAHPGLGVLAVVKDWDAVAPWRKAGRPTTPLSKCKFPLYGLSSWPPEKFDH